MEEWEEQAKRREQARKEIAERDQRFEDLVKEKLQRRRLEMEAQHADSLQKFEFLVNHNQALQDEKDSLERKMARMADRQKDLDKRKEELQLLTKSVNNQQQEVEKWKKRCQRLRAKLEKRKSAQQSALDEQQTLRQNVDSMAEKIRQKDKDMDKLKAQIGEVRACRMELQEDVMEAVSILRPIVENSETVESARPKLLKMREIMQRTYSVSSDPTEEISGGPNPQTAEPKPEGSKDEDLRKDPFFVLTRYRTGDLGLIPRPTWDLSKRRRRTSKSKKKK